MKTLTLLCSAFFRDHDKALWAETIDTFRSRGQRAAASRNHCKVITFAFESGVRLALEGSANLRSNGNWEQFALFNDAGLYDFHAGWIDAEIEKHKPDNRNPGDAIPGNGSRPQPSDATATD